MPVGLLREPANQWAKSHKALKHSSASLRRGTFFYQDDSVNKARQFSLSFKGEHDGIVDSHLIEVSAAFPKALFLPRILRHASELLWQASDAGGRNRARSNDKDQKSQALDWALLDIFAPFRAEYCEEKPFGSLWNRWLEDIVAAAKQLLQEAKEKPV